MTSIFGGLAKRLGLAKDYFEDEFIHDLRKEMEDIPEESVQEPRASIALPAMQGLAYTLDEPDLKSLFLNLISTASDSRVSNTAHPSFVEFLRQLTSDEATMLRLILPHTHLPIGRVKNVERATNYFTIVHNHVLPWSNDAGEPAMSPFGATFVDNWIRLGIVVVDYDAYLTDAGRYDFLDTRPEVITARNLYSNDLREVHVDRGMLTRTNLGAQFAKAVGLID